MKTFVSTLVIVICLTSLAQPNTEVYLFDLTPTKTEYTLSNPVNISDNEGYDNQPSFWPDGQSILYARTVNGQTEIARYFIASGETTIITKTLQGSEYSPTPMPDGRISSVRLDTTGLQLLYAYDLDGNHEVLVDELVIGYHAWISETDIVAFVLGEPVNMQIVDTQKDEKLVIGDSIGRSLHSMPLTDNFSYVDKSVTPWVIKTMNPKTGHSDPIIPVLDGSEDYCWSPKGELFMGQGEVLYFKVNSETWRECGSIAEFGIKGSISRMAISPKGDQMAIVISQ